jgi:hypothetical protein
MQRKILSLVVLAVLGALAPLQGSPPEEPKRAEVLVLGVYHMANPGRDLFNTQADDVLAPRRQKEIAELTAVLAKFRPTRIAIESNYGEDKYPKRYAEYLAGTLELSRNEIEQVGFRLAKELGHTAIYPVDADGDFPFPRVVNYAKATGQSAKLDALLAEIGKMVKEQNEYLKAHTILETLLLLNSDAAVARDLGFYALEARYGEPGDYAGPDLLAEWYRRNIRIYNNLTKIVTSPDDRILMIFGAGHLGWLRQDIAADPTLRLRKLDEIAGPRP